MDSKSIFRKYYGKVARQGFLKALLFSATVGFAANFLAAFFLWFTHLKIAWVLIVSLGVFLLVTLLLTPIAYFKRFRPTASKIAWLIDRLGYEERMVTMCEMEKDESYVAMLQREDAKAKLSHVSRRDVGLKFTRFAVILPLVVFVLSASMTTVSALAATGGAKHGGEIFSPPPEEEENEEEKEYVTVDYIAGEGGAIEGKIHQRIEKGTDADPVTATPFKGYVFVVWSDGIMTAQRWDWSVVEDMSVEAQFEPLPEDEKGDGDSGEDGENGEEEGDGEDKDQNEGDEGEDGEDGEKGDGENDGNENGENGDGEGKAPGEGDGPQGGGENPGLNNGQEGDGDADGTGSGEHDGGGPGKGDSSEGHGSGPGANPGKNSDNNHIVDGKTDYHDVVDAEKNKSDLADDDSLPPELKDILDGYFDSLKP